MGQEIDIVVTEVGDQLQVIVKTGTGIVTKKMITSGQSLNINL